MRIRPVVEGDLDAVLALNLESVWALSPLSAEQLPGRLEHVTYALVCEIDDEVAAFAFAYQPGASYDSVNYRWHAQRFDDFLYLDRIAVGHRFRRRGIASLLYDDLEEHARSHGRMVCEVNADPPNVESLAFHSARGYREIGHLAQADGHVTVMMEKPL